jgi:hypothetical protein
MMAKRKHDEKDDGWPDSPPPRGYDWFPWRKPTITG